VIRVATPVDAPELARLQSFLPEPAPALLDSALERGVTPATALVSTAAPGATAPVGYLLAVPGDDTVYVAELVVAPAHRREGRARALLDACAARAGEATLIVTVAVDDEAARACYRACGFEVDGRVAGLFDGGDAVRYRRD
jgi:ribosomal-protein-alanine N-acetyltransferase